MQGVGNAVGQREGSEALTRILVVEDERVVALDLCRALADMGYLVGRSARSSHEALELAAADAPDLILMDIRIDGGSDGIEAATQLKLLHQVPIVFLTASTDEMTMQRAFRARPHGYLPKPFTRATLRSAIEVALQRHEVESQLRLTNDQLAAQKSELERRTGELRMLSEMGEYLQLCDSPAEVTAIVSQFWQPLFPHDRGVLYLIQGAGTSLCAAASWGHEGPLPPLDVHECRSLRGGQLHRVALPHNPLRCAHLGPHPELASICVAMTTDGKPIGILSVTFPLALPPDAAAMRAKAQLTTGVAQRIGLTLTNLRIKDQLTKESTLDPLTGLFNRRHLAAAFDRELRLASRGLRPVGVLMFDLDRFKEVNDEFGHAAADRVLCEVAGMLRARLRADDVPARYGGDETVVLLPDTTLEGARIVAEKLRVAVRELRVAYGGRTLPPVSISVGVGAYPASGGDADALLKAVDVALYRAKGEGRDRVAMARA